MSQSLTSSSSTADPRAFSTFASLWACATLVHQLSFPFWMGSWEGWLLTTAVIAVLMQPGCLLSFACLALASMAKLYHNLPFVPNHMLFEGVAHFSMLLGMAWAIRTFPGSLPSRGEVVSDLWRRFRIFLSLAVIKVLHLQFTRDNDLLGAVTTLALAISLGWALMGRKPYAAVSNHFFHQTAPVLRIAIAFVYFWAAIQKLNWDYLNPAISCAAEMHQEIAGYFPFLPIPTDTWALHGAIWGSFVFEIGIPLLLIFRPTRILGFVAGSWFHLWLSVTHEAGVYSFSGLAFAIFYLFLSQNAAVRMRQHWDEICRWIGRGNPARGGRLAAFGVIGLFFGGLILQSALYLSMGQQRSVFDDANRVGMTLFLFFGCWMAYSYLRACFKTARQSQALPNHVGWTPAWIVLLFVIWNGINPWIGLKTQTSFSMYSNLRSEADYRWERGNHVFLRRIDLFPFQKNMVELLESEPDILAVPPNPRSVRYWANAGDILPLFELRRHLSEHEGDVHVIYRLHGELHEAKRENGVASPPELFESYPWYIYKYFWFRRHVSLTEPMHCTH